MARRFTTAGADLFADLARKMEILEEELKVQRAALDRLKKMGPADRVLPRDVSEPVRRSA